LTVDITTVEVIKGALIYAAEEMGIALKKSAYSPNIKERMDHCSTTGGSLSPRPSTYPCTSAAWP
jgi:N-methylhydantoinase B/oxoprolinase/acetone carboxylase alpha subunit